MLRGADPQIFMFAAAYRQAASFTKPVIISHVRVDGQCFAGVGTFVVVNAEGWILTSNHIMTEYAKLAQAKQAAKDRAAAIEAIQQNAGLLPDQKRKQIKKLGDLANKAATDFSFWWAADGVVVKDVHAIPSADIAVGRLDPFDGAAITNYPTFKDPTKAILNGTSLCRLGFPFHEIKPTYAGGTFTLPPDTFPMVFFPNEGILTRVLIVDQNAPIFAGFIETSSPGLKGQSGGPIFDQHGTVWGIQSHTENLPLGFSPSVPGRPDQREHQFLNVGRGTHPGTIVGLLNQIGVKHAISAY